MAKRISDFLKGVVGLGTAASIFLTSILGYVTPVRAQDLPKTAEEARMEKAQEEIERFKQEEKERETQEAYQKYLESQNPALQQLLQEEQKTQPAQVQPIKQVQPKEKPVQKPYEQPQEQPAKAQPKQEEQEKQIKKYERKIAEKERVQYGQRNVDQIKELRDRMDYVLGGNTGYEKKYAFDSLDDLLDENLKGIAVSNVIAGLYPKASVFETFDESGKRAVVIDMPNNERKSAVLYKLNDDKISSIELLLENDLNEKVLNYVKNSNLIGKPVYDVLKNIKKLHNKNARVVRDFKKKFKDGYIFLKTPRDIANEEDIYGCMYEIKDNKIVKIVGLDEEKFYRAIEKPLEFSFAVAGNKSSGGNSGADSYSLDGIIAGDGRIYGTRSKIKVDCKDDMIKQAQLVFSNTSKRNNKFSIGSSFFQDKLKDSRNYSFNEIDLFFNYMSKGLIIDFLGGVTEDSEDYGKTSVNNYTLRQWRNGKSDFLINLDTKIKMGEQMPFVWGEPMLMLGIAHVPGKDEYNYEWSSNNNVVSSGTFVVPSNYSTAAADFKNKWKVGGERNIILESMIGAQYNKFSREENSKMNDYTHMQKRAGINAEYDTLNFKPSLMIVYQENSNTGRAGKNINGAGSVQVAYIPAERFAMLLNAYGEGFNNSNETELSLLYSHRARRFIDDETRLGKDKAMYAIKNNNALLPLGINPDVLYVPFIYEGIKLAGSVGKDKYGMNFSKALIDLYLGKGLGIGASYERKGSESKSLVRLTKNL